jgi:hypothetical protein
MGCATTCEDANPCTDDACGPTGVCMHVPKSPGAPGNADEGPCVGVCQTDGACGLTLYSRSFPNPAVAWSSEPLSLAWTGPNAPPPRGILAAEHANATDARLLVWADDGNFYLQKNGSWELPVPIAAAFPGVGASTIKATEMFQSQPGGDHSILILTTGTTPRRGFLYVFQSNDAIVADAMNPYVIMPTSDPQGAPQDAVDCDWSFALQTAYVGTPDWVIFWRHFGTKVYEYNGGNDDWMANWDDAASPLWMGTTGGPAPGSVVAAYYDEGTVYFVAP